MRWPSLFLIATSAAAAAAIPAARAPALLAAGMVAYQAHDFTRARGLFTALADQGSAVGETMLGTMCAHGEAERRDPAAAAGYYFRAASRGYAPAQLAFARALARGDGVARDLKAAAMWARLARLHGDAAVVAAWQATMPPVPDAATNRAAAAWQPWPRPD